MTTAAESAAAAYAGRIDAIEQQRRRLSGDPPPADRWSGAMARLFRADPRRELDAATAVIAADVRPNDVLIDVGGGAGRLGLPLALRCREVINVEPSPGMGEEFEALAKESGISNVRLIRKDWLEADGVRGDVALAAHVTYFVRDIAGFIRRMQAAAARRAVLFIASPPPPARSRRLYQHVFGEDQVLVPGQAELLPVLWELGILPDVHMLPGIMPLPGALPATREEAVQTALRTLGLGTDSARRAEAQARIERDFAALFAETAQGFQPLYTDETRGIIISWETNPAAA
ncbi:MAG TPA: methyltransferase domain-containing protein [Dehalococcoidia bacterium]|nr:methyltransferase domain-containing protein [Dehalococcoidia bacterium]